MKPITISLRLDEKQFAMLEALCAHHRRTQSDLIRILIEDEYLKVQGADA